MDPLKERLGEVLQDRYKIIRFLGRGGMGAVFLCEDLRLPGKRWALKEMLVYDLNVAEQVEESFKREAEMLARLRHRNLPIIVDYFFQQNKQYLVMEYIEGETLATVVGREGPANETQALRWALELAQVLDYLHRQDKPVIFRDLKPENIIISEDRHVKLVDFGLARQFDPVKARDTQASGSVGYAPPEQWEDVTQTDERSDIYSLGATLYYVLTGRPPSPIYGSHRLRPHRPDLESGTEAVVLRCLQPDPSNRYSGTGELIRDLLLLLSRERHQREIAPTGEGRGRSLPNVPAPVITPPRPTGRRRERALTAPRLSLRGLTVQLLVATIVFLTGAALGLIRPPLDPTHLPGASPLAATAAEREQARQAIERKDYSRAIEILDNLVTRHPEDAESHILKANAYVWLQGKPYYRVAVMTSTSGSDLEGYQLLSGLALAQAELNRQGVREHMLVLDVYDDESRLDRALELAERIAKNQDYAVAVGPYTSQLTLAVAPMFDAGGLPDVAPVASDPRVWVAGEYVFTASDSDTRRVEALANHFVAKGLLAGAVFHDAENVVSRSMADEFLEEYTRLGGKVVASGSYQESNRNFEAVVDKIVGSGAQFVFLAEYRSAILASFAQELRRAGSTIPIGAQTAAFNPKVVAYGGSAVEGLLTSTYFHPEAPSPAIQGFTRSFMQTFGGLKPSHREANAYDTLMLVGEAIRQVGFERKALRDYLASLGDSRPAYPGVTGKFAPGRRLDMRQPYLVELRQGVYTLRLPEALPSP